MIKLCREFPRHSALPFSLVSPGTEPTCDHSEMEHMSRLHHTLFGPSLGALFGLGHKVLFSVGRGQSGPFPETETGVQGVHSLALSAGYITDKLASGA